MEGFMRIEVWRVFHMEGFMRIEVYDVTDKPYPYRRRPWINDPTIWVAMTKWCANRCCKWNSTWFLFEAKEDADEFVRVWEKSCVDMSSNPIILGPHTRWDLMSTAFG